MGNNNRKKVIEFERLLSEMFRLSQNLKNPQNITVDKTGKYIEDAEKLSNINLELYNKYQEMHRLFIRGNY